MTVPEHYPQQCVQCRYWRRSGGLILPLRTRCAHFTEAGELAPWPAKILIGLTALYTTLAAKNECPGFEALVYGPDAYRSQDLWPESELDGDPTGVPPEAGR